MSAQKLLTLARELEDIMGAQEADALLHVAAPQAVDQIAGLCRHSPAQVTVEPREVQFDLSRAVAGQFLFLIC